MDGYFDGWSFCPHNEILLTPKTGYVAIASRLGFGINLVTMIQTTEGLEIMFFIAAILILKASIY
jgi:hypothetical protein